MGKIKLGISDMFCQCYGKTVKDPLTGLKDVQGAKENLRPNDQDVHFESLPISYLTAAVIKKGLEAVKKTRSLPLKLMYTILIILFCITGCSDMPYTGPLPTLTHSMLTPDDIDKYIVSPDAEILCLQNRSDSVCLTLIPEGKDLTSPIIHIYPSSISYVFYYEGKPILQAERQTDNTDIIEDLSENGNDDPTGGNNPGGDNNPGNDDPTGGNNPGGNNNPDGDDPTGGNNPGGNNNPDGDDPTGGNNPGGNNNPDGDDPTGGNNPGGNNNPGDIISHYVFSNPPNNLNGDEWIVWIYYPDDYSGPRGLPDSSEGYGFTIAVDGGETTQFAQVSGGERGPGVRLIIQTNQPEILVTVTWNPPYTDRSATFTLKSDVNIADY